MVWLLLLSVANPLALEARVHGSIEASLRRVSPKEGAALAAQAARLLQWRGDIVRNVQPNDAIALLYEPSEEPQLVALIYEGAEITLEAHLFDGDGVERFYDETGTLVEPRLKNAPTDYVQITEVVQHGSGKRRHFGLDLKADLGTPVVLPFASRVSRVNWSTRYNGNCIEVISNNGMYVRFLHLDSVDASVTPGKRMAAGARIGTVGSSGRSSAPHLHYGLRSKNGDLLDPLEVHGTESVTLPKQARGAFDAQRARHLELLGKTPAASL